MFALVLVFVTLLFFWIEGVLEVTRLVAWVLVFIPFFVFDAPDTRRLRRLYTLILTI